MKHFPLIPEYISLLYKVNKILKCCFKKEFLNFKRRICETVRKRKMKIIVCWAESSRIICYSSVYRNGYNIG